MWNLTFSEVCRFLWSHLLSQTSPPLLGRFVRTIVQTTIVTFSRRSSYAAALLLGDMERRFACSIRRCVPSSDRLGKLALIRCASPQRQHALDVDVLICWQRDSPGALDISWLRRRCCCGVVAVQHTTQQRLDRATRQEATSSAHLHRA